MAAAPKELAAYAAITRKCSVRKLTRAAEGKTLFAINSRIVGNAEVRNPDFGKSIRAPGAASALSKRIDFNHRAQE